MQRVAGGRSGGTPGVVAAHAVVKKIALSETSLKPEAPAAVTLDFNAGVEPAGIATALARSAQAAYYEKPTIPTAITAGVETYWSDYNHNVAGLFLVAMGVVALLSFFEIGRWTYYWPLGFVGLGIFQWLRSDVESSPFGPMGFWERFLAELDHRLSIVLVLALGVLELRARTTGKPDARLPYVFPVLCAIGGLLLLGNSHSAFELKQEYLLQVTHTAMGSLAVIMACARWLELRLRPSVGRGGRVLPPSWRCWASVLYSCSIVRRPLHTVI